MNCRVYVSPAKTFMLALTIKIIIIVVWSGLYFYKNIPHQNTEVVRILSLIKYIH